MKQFFVKEFLLESINTATLKESSVTFLGTLINAGLGAVFYVLTARILGPINFGLFIVAITTLTLISDVGNLGTDSGLVRFVSKYIISDQEKALRFLKLSLEVKLSIFLIISIIGWFFAPFIAKVIFRKEFLEYPVRLAFLGAGGLLLFSFSTSALQSFQKFWQWSGLLIGTNTLRVLIILLLTILGKMNLNGSLEVYIFIPFLGFIASFFFLPREFLGVGKAYLVRNEFFHYGKWIALSTVVSALSSRLDIFLVARLLSAEQIGFYAAAGQLVAIAPQLASALGTVLAPKMASIGSEKDLLTYLKKTQMLVLLLAALGALAIPVVEFLVPYIYGSSYVEAVPRLFIVLALAMIIFLISIPVHSTISYYYAYPKLFLFLSIGHLFLIGILGWILILALGAMGAALTVLIGSVLDLTIPVLWLVYKIKK